MGEMRHAGVFEGEDKVDGYLCGVEFRGHTAEWVLVSRVGEV